MKIKINGTDFIVFEYDDNQTIVERYSVTQNQSLPSYYRIDGTDFTLAEGVKLTIVDVRDTIKKLIPTSLGEKFILESILASYRSLKKTEIGVLWIKQFYKFKNNKSETPIDVTTLKQLDKYAFTTSARAEMTVTDFDAETEIKRNALKKKIEDAGGKVELK